MGDRCIRKNSSEWEMGTICRDRDFQKVVKPFPMSCLIANDLGQIDKETKQVLAKTFFSRMTFCFLPSMNKGTINIRRVFMKETAFFVSKHRTMTQLAGGLLHCQGRIVSENICGGISLTSFGI
jgi:hypothetical protein